MFHFFTRASLLAFIPTVVFACGAPEPSLEASDGLFQLPQPIIGGSLDREHPAVMLLAHRTGFLCTGTVIHVEAQTGYLLTAAHCATEENDDRETVPLRARDFIVVPGEDFAESTTAFGVTSVAVEPRYEGGLAEHDIAIAQFALGNAPAPRAIPALLPSDDALDVGDPLLLVGFGQTETDEANTQRRRVERDIEALDAELLAYSQADARGTCFGDSGGPGIVEVDGEERVAGVISGGVDNDDSCAGGFGVSTRVSGYQEFIDGVLP